MTSSTQKQTVVLDDDSQQHAKRIPQIIYDQCELVQKTQEKYLNYNYRFGYLELILPFFTAVNFIIYFFSSCIQHTGDGANISWLYYYVQWLIVTIQCCRYMTDHYIGFRFNSAIMDTFHKIIEFVSFFPNFGDYSFPYLLACGCVITTVLVVVFSSLAHRYLNWTFQFHIARATVLLLPYLLFVPISEALLQVVVPCFSAARHPLLGSGCWEGTHAVQAAFAMLALAFLMVFSLLADQCFYAAELSAELNINPLTHGCNGVSDNTHLSKLRIGSVVLSTLFLAADDDSWRMPLAMLYFIASAGLFTIKYLVLPHYNDFAQALHLARTLAAVLTGAVMLVSASRALEGAPAHQHDLVILYLASMPLTVVIGMLAVTHRYAHVGSAPAQELTTPSLMILAARARLRRFLLQIAAHGDAYVADSAYLQEERLAMSQDFDGLLTVALGRFPDSAPMRIFAALFYTHVLDNRNLAHAQLQQLPPREDLPLRHAFLVGQLRALLDAATQRSQSLEVQAYIEFKRRKEVVDAASMGCLASLLSFWTELLRPLPDADALITLAVAARAQLQTCHVNYKALLEINPNSVPVLRTYGLLLLDLIGDLPRASALFARADTVERERSVALMSTAQSGDFLSRVDTNLDIFDERNAVFGISVERARMGEVETINPAVTRMFGLQGKDIVGGNISRIIPSPIAEVHNDILERYLVHKTSRIVNYTRMAFGLHASGYIFPVHLYVRWADEGNAKFLGVLQSVPLDNDVHLMLDPARRTVAYATPNAHSLLGLSLRAVAEGAAAADTLIPCLAGDDGEARLEVMRSRLGLETSCRHALTGALSPCRVWCVETPVMGRRVVFLRVVLDTAAEADAGAGWDSECSDQEVVSLADRFADVLEGGPADDGDAGGLSPSLSPSLRGRRGSLASSLASADGSVGAVASCSEVNPVFSGRRAAPRGSGLGLGLGAGLCRVPETEVGAAEAASSPGACSPRRPLLQPSPYLAGRRLGPASPVRSSSAHGDSPADPVLLLESGLSPHAPARPPAAPPASTASAATAATSVVSGAGSGTGALRGKMQSSALRRLRKAVRAHQRALAGRVSRAGWVLAAVVTAVAAVVIAQNLILSHFCSRLALDMRVLATNNARLTWGLDGFHHHRAWRLLNAHPGAGPLFQRDFTLQPYVAGAAVPVTADAQLLPLLRQRANAGLDAVAEASRYLAAHPEATYLRFLPPTKGPVPRLNPAGDGYDTEMLSIEEAAFLWVAAGHAALETGRTAAADRLMASVVDVSGFTALVAMSTAFTPALLRAVDADASALYTWTAAAAAAGLVLVLLAGLLSLLPAVRVVEKAKTEVLGLLLGVPAEVRRLVRKRLLGLRALVAARDAGDAAEDAGGGDEWMAEGEGRAEDEEEGSQSLLGSSVHGGSIHSRFAGSSVAAEEAAAHMLAQGHAPGHAPARGGHASDAFRAQMRQQCYAKFAANRAPLPSSAAARYGRLARTLEGRPDLLFHPTASTGPGAGPAAGLGDALAVDLGRLTRAAAAAATTDATDPAAAAARAHEAAREKVAASRAAASARAAVRHLLALLPLLALLAVFAGVALWEAATVGTHHSDTARLADATAAQSAYLAHALTVTREHLLFDFAALAASDPLSPFLMLGPYPPAAAADLRMARQAHRDAVYGSSPAGTHPELYRGRSDPVNYGSVCALAPLLGPAGVPGPRPASDPAAGAVFADVWGACPAQLDGVLTKGLDAAMIYALDIVDSVVHTPATAASLAAYLAAMPPAGPSPADGAAFASLAIWRLIESLALDYMVPAGLYLSASFEDAAADAAAAAASVCLLLGLTVGAALALLSVLAYRAQLHRLHTAAAQTTGTLLLLTPELAKSVPSITRYIQEQCARED